MKLSFLMSHCRKNSVRDKVIGNKWIYLKRNTLHRQCGLSQNVSCCSVTQLCPTLCYPMDWSTPVFPVLHHLLEFAQTSVLWVSDTVQWSHPLLPPPPPAFNFSQHQGFFSNESPGHIRWSKCWSFSFSISPSSEYSELISFTIDWFDLLQSKGLSRIFSNTTVQKHQFFSAQPSLCSNSHIHTWLLEKP